LGVTPPGHGFSSQPDMRTGNSPQVRVSAFTGSGSVWSVVEKALLSAAGACPGPCERLIVFDRQATVKVAVRLGSRCPRG